MTSGPTSAIALMAAVLAFSASPLEAQGKGKGSEKEKAQAAESRGQGRSARAAKDVDHSAHAGQEKGQARADNRGRGNQDAARPDNRGRGNAAKANADNRRTGVPADTRGRARAAEVREMGGDVAGPADFSKRRSSDRFFRVFDPNDTPERFRGFAMSPRLPERYVGRVAALALARGVPENSLVITPSGDRYLIANSNGVVLLDLDDQRARNLGAFRVVSLDGDDDDDKDGAPSFCRSGAGHPNWGRQWCVDKGFGLGNSNDLRWGRVVSPQDVILRRSTSTGDLTRDVLASVLGDVVFNRLAAHAITLGLVDPLVGRWVAEPTGRRVLLVNSGAVPVAELVDDNDDDRPEVVLVALKPW